MMMMTGPLILGIGWPGGGEWLILLVLALLIFGRRLPEVGRSLGRGIVEFKKGIKGIEDEIEEESSRPSGASVAPAEPRRQELPRPAAPAEPRVSRGGDDAAADNVATPAGGETQRDSA
jgi:sec-independent protein translocase protein TatA